MSDKIFKYKVIVEAVDKPLKSMQEQLKSINDIFKKQTEEIKKATEAVNSLANTYKKFEIGKLAVKGLSMGLSSVVDIAGKGMDVLKDFGGMTLDAMQFRERSVFSLGRAFGDGTGKLQEIIDLASKTTMDTGPMVTMANALSTSFKHWEDVKKIMVLGGDVLYQFPELEQQFTAAFQKAGSGGMLEAGSDLLKSISGGYIGYKREIAKQLGMNGKDLDSITKVDELIKAAKKNGKLTGRELTRALIKSLKAGLKMENIGDITMGAAQGSLIGAVSNFRSSFSDVLVAIDWENIPGVGELKRVLNSVTQNIMSQDTRNAIRAAIDNMLAPLEKLDNEKIGSLFRDTLIPGITKFGAIINDSLSWLVDLMTGNVTLSSSTEKVWVTLGETIGLGIAGGIKKSVPSVWKILEGISIGTADMIYKIPDYVSGSSSSNNEDTEKLNSIHKRIEEQRSRRQAEWRKAHEDRIQEQKKIFDDQLKYNAKADQPWASDAINSPTMITVNIGSATEKDAVHIANTVAKKVKETTEADKRAAKNLRMSGGKS